MSKSKHQHRVEEFMFRAKQDVPISPTTPDEKVRRLRATLILEEAIETINALGFSVDVPELIGGRVPDIVEVVDGCCDIKVVTTGTLSAFGVSDGVQKIVDQNNLAKFGPGHRIREDGKLIKPFDHVPATEEIKKYINENTKKR